MARNRVWFDVLTPKQVLFFHPIANYLESRGIETLVTSRMYREVRPVAEMIGLQMKFIGERGTQGRLGQLVASTKRQEELIPLIGKFDPGVAVSIASGVCARIAFGLGFKHISVNDSPHSEVAGRLTLPFTHRLLCPWIIPYSAWERYGFSRAKITRYRALDPAVWLKRPMSNGPVPDLVEGRQTIVVRTEETDAPYMLGSDKSWGDLVLETVVKNFPDSNIVVLCRYPEQLRRVAARFGKSLIVPEEVIDGRRLLSMADLFIGLGGTMTAEASLSGVPSIATFQGSLYTERYLMSVGLLEKTRSPSTLAKLGRRMLDSSYRSKHSAKAKRVLQAMEDPVPKVSGIILETLEQG